MRKPHAENFWVIALGGLAGAFARWGLQEALSQGVLAANTAGSFLLGLVVADFLRDHDSPKRLLAIDFLTSFCGCFTTFSAVALVAAEHFEAGSAGAGIGSLALSFGLGLPASYVGFWWWKRRHPAVPGEMMR